MVLLVACTSTRQLPSIDPRLRVGEHDGGFVVHTTERWNERVDPNTVLRFHRADGMPSERLYGRDLFVDHDGVWIERSTTMWGLVDAVRIEGLGEAAAAQLAATRPDGARLEREGDAWILSTDRRQLSQWLLQLELAIARLDPRETIGVCGSPCLDTHPLLLEGDDAKLYALRIVHSGAPLGTWSVSANGGAWLPPLRGIALVDFLDYGRTTKVGWRWNDIASIEVENISGGKTLGAIVGTAAAAVVLAPVALVLNGVGRGGGHGGRGGSISSGSRAGATAAAVALGGSGTGGRHDPIETWNPELAPRTSLTARPLFSTGTRVRSIVRPTLAFDSAVGIRADLVATGVIARLRFMDVFELGGGVRMTAATGHASSTRSITGVFQVGLHLPLDAGFRFAIPLGFEAGAGGDVARDLRVPWGLRYTQGRWFATALPASPSYLRLAHEEHGRWSLASGVELGTSF